MVAFEGFVNDVWFSRFIYDVCNEVVQRLMMTRSFTVSKMYGLSHGPADD